MSRIDQPPSVPSSPQTPRRAEETDTRQALQRHDPEFYRKKKDDDAEGGFQDPYEDLTDVSVPAVKNFLLGLLDRAENAAQPDAPAAASITGEPARQPASPQAAAAMQAYKTGAARGVAAPPPPPPPPPPSSGPAPQGSALDRAAAGLDRAEVLDLVRALDDLYAKGITTITLEKGEGFLASIRTAIAKAVADAAGA